MAATDDDDANARLRPQGRRATAAIRRQKRLSLQEVEARPSQEFKASVLGAYERGERAISVPRLQRLARFYRVPVDQLLPVRRGRPARSTTDGRSDPDAGAKIDLTRLESLGGPEAEMLARYLADDPGAAAGLQRPGAHHPPRRPAGHRLHPRRPRGGGRSAASTSSA